MDKPLQIDHGHVVTMKSHTPVGLPIGKYSESAWISGWAALRRLPALYLATSQKIGAGITLSSVDFHRKDPEGSATSLWP